MYIILLIIHALGPSFTKMSCQTMMPTNNKWLSQNKTLRYPLAQNMLLPQIIYITNFILEGRCQAIIPVTLRR